MPKVATWNVNSVKARLPHLLRWLKEATPDVVLLQEIKVQTGDFPALEIEELGYNIAAVGQKSYNGVAILSKRRIEVEQEALPGDDADSQARYLEAVVGTLRVATIYLPNGNPAPGEKFDYKLAWMRRLVEYGRELLLGDMPVVLGGDFNVCPTDADVYDPEAWRADALCRPESRALFRELVYLGFTEAWRALHPDAENAYTSWDYQAGAWDRDAGLRIDHLLLSPQAADMLEAADIDKGPRGGDKPSDHTPVWCTLAEPGRAGAT